MRLALMLAVIWTATGSMALADDVLRVVRATTPVTIVGYSRSITTATISAEVAGKITRVAYDVGDRVGKGPAVTIDDTFVRLELAQVAETIRRVGLALERARIGYRFREKEYTRIAQLFQSGTASENELDRVAELRDNARLDADGLVAELALSEVQRKTLRERLRRHRVKAPVGWQVVSRHVEPGEFAAVGMPLVTVADFSRLVVPLTVSDDQRSALVSAGDTIRGRLGDTPADARIRWINPKFDPVTRKIALELVLTQFSGPARGGRRFEVVLTIPALGLMVPKAAVDRRFGNPRVVRSDTGQWVSVQLLGESETHYRIAGTKGLSLGDALRAAPYGSAAGREPQ